MRAALRTAPLRRSLHLPFVLPCVLPGPAEELVSWKGSILEQFDSKAAAALTIKATISLGAIIRESG